MENSTIVLNNAKNWQKYYAVHCRCGHVGRDCYVEIVFAIIATSRKDAAEKARWFARVKHNRKNAIINCYEITREEYEKIIEINKNDPYLKCKNIQEQRSIIGFESRILKEPVNLALRKTKRERKEFVQYKLRKQKQFIEALNMSMIMSV